jgi:hypothetical protein
MPTRARAVVLGVVTMHGMPEHVADDILSLRERDINELDLEAMVYVMAVVSPVRLASAVAQALGLVRLVPPSSSVRPRLAIARMAMSAIHDADSGRTDNHHADRAFRLLADDWSVVDKWASYVSNVGGAT